MCIRDRYIAHREREAREETLFFHRTGNRNAFCGEMPDGAFYLRGGIPCDRVITSKGVCHETVLCRPCGGFIIDGIPWRLWKRPAGAGGSIPLCDGYLYPVSYTHLGWPGLPRNSWRRSTLCHRLFGPTVRLWRSRKGIPFLSLIHI